LVCTGREYVDSWDTGSCTGTVAHKLKPRRVQSLYCRDCTGTASITLIKSQGAGYLGFSSRFLKRNSYCMYHQSCKKFQGCLNVKNIYVLYSNSNTQGTTGTRTQKLHTVLVPVVRVLVELLPFNGLSRVEKCSISCTVPVGTMPVQIEYGTGTGTVAIVSVLRAGIFTVPVSSGVPVRYRCIGPSPDGEEECQQYILWEVRRVLVLAPGT
jgi:hypothetical protein